MKKSILAPVLSAFVWGSGQFFVCKQRVKGLLFFAIQALLVGIELNTGYWIEWLTGQVPNFNLREHAGFFTHGIWGFITLGDIPGARNGDHSTTLMITGIISILLLMIFAIFYIVNIVDAKNSAKELEKTKQYMTSKQSLKNIYEKSFEYIILSPVLILILMVSIMPMLFSFLTAFTNYNRDHLPPANLVSWVGLESFEKLFTVPVWSETFSKILVWTCVWAVLATVSCYLLGMFQAIIINDSRVKCKKLFRTILILPWAMPSFISLLVFKNLLNGQFGPLNQFLLDIGLISERIGFLTDPNIAKISILTINLWLGFPSAMLMILGLMSNMDQSAVEAASIDGATKRQTFSFITFPIILKATTPLLIMTLAFNFNNFGAVYFLTGGGPVNPNLQFAGDTDILISWIYKLTLEQRMYNMAAVMSILIFIVIGSVSFWNFRRTSAFKEA